MKNTSLLCLAACASFLGGCGPTQDSTPAVSLQTKTASARLQATAVAAAPAGRKLTFSTFPVPAKPSVTAEFVEHGKKIFQQNCASCHGEKGDGQGLCSSFLLPRPRNFKTAHFRLRSTLTGALPTDEDLFRAVSLGVVGTPMPPWKWVLNDTDRWAVVEYVKVFSPRFSDPGEARTNLVDIGTPPPRTEAAVTEGKALFEKMSCASCHGPTGQGDGPSSYSLVDDSGQRIAARDFSKPSGFKAGTPRGRSFAVF